MLQPADSADPAAHRHRVAQAHPVEHVGCRSLRQVAPTTCRRSAPQRRSQAVLWSTCSGGRRRLCTTRRSGPRSRTPLRPATAGKPQPFGPVVHMAQFSPDNLKTTAPSKKLSGTHTSRTAKAATKRIMQAPTSPNTYRSPAGHRPDQPGATAGSQQAPRRVPQRGSSGPAPGRTSGARRPDRTELPGPQPGQVSQAVPAVGDGDRKVGRHRARQVHRRALVGDDQRRRPAPGQARQRRINALLPAEVHEDPAEVVGVFLHPVVQRLDLLLVQEP